MFFNNQYKRLSGTVCAVMITYYSYKTIINLDKSQKVPSMGMVFAGAPLKEDMTGRNCMKTTRTNTDGNHGKIGFPYYKKEIK